MDPVDVTHNDSIPLFLGMLTKQYPEIALSIKTRQASRSVLNQMRDGVQELTMDGIIEETEGHKIEKVCCLSETETVRI